MSLFHDDSDNFSLLTFMGEVGVPLILLTPITSSVEKNNHHETSSNKFTKFRIINVQWLVTRTVMIIPYWSYDNDDTTILLLLLLLLLLSLSLLFWLIMNHDCLFLRVSCLGLFSPNVSTENLKPKGSWSLLAYCLPYSYGRKGKRFIVGAWLL